MQKSHAPSPRIRLWLAGFLILTCTLVKVSPGRAATVWSDDFSDGDYAGWTVEAGTFTAVNYRLENAGDILNSVFHASTVATGTWRFDLDVICPITFYTHHGGVDFMTIDIDPLTHYPANGYEVAFNFAEVWLNKIVDGEYTNLAKYHIGANTEGALRALEHVDVTRNTAGDLHVWVNGTHRIYCQDTTFSSSTYFVLASDTSVAHWLDNVVVSDTVDIEPPTTTTPIPGFAAPAIILGLVVALATAVVYRRRRP